jgi:DNA-binding response OmpR family regulator
VIPPCGDVKFTSLDRAVLLLLLTDQGRVVDYERLADKAWGKDASQTTIQTGIFELRKRLKKAGWSTLADRIESIAKEGYILRSR